MIPLHDLEKHFQHLPPDSLDILIEIHNLVARVSPAAIEDIRRDGVVYYDAGRGGPVSGGICQALFEPGDIRLAFNLGVFLPDPAGLLEGERVAKRFMHIRSYDDAPWEQIAALIQASAHFDVHLAMQDNIEWD
jgi:hypothetical protein